MRWVSSSIGFVNLEALAQLAVEAGGSWERRTWSVIGWSHTGARFAVLDFRDQREAVDALAELVAQANG